MNINSLQTRLVGFTVVVILLAASVPLYLSLQQFQILYRDSVHQNIEGLSTNMANELIGLEAANADEVALTTFLLELEVYPDIRLARIYSADWQVLAQYVAPAADYEQLNALYPAAALQRMEPGVHFEHNAVVQLTRIGHSAFPQGYLLIVEDYGTTLAERSRQLLLSVLPFSAGGVLVLILLAILSHRGILLPLFRLSEFARRVERTGDYSLRLTPRGNDEVAQLAVNISHMMEKIDAEMAINQAKTRQVLEQQQAMTALANHDSLTGLPNRQFFMELLRLELARAVREKTDVAIMFFDLDDFKRVNDTLGHEVGDLLLVEVSKRVRSLLREGDVLARLGGDEFLVLLQHPDPLILNYVAERIIAAFAEPLKIRDWSLKTGVSIGIASASQANFNLSACVSSADLAMYRSKMSGKGSYTFFDQSMLEDDKRRRQIAGSVTDGLAAGEFYVVYQAKVCRNQRVAGFEALVRWNSPVLGVVSPDELIPIAEQSGKIHEISRWMIDRVCADLVTIQARAGANAVVSVNLSALDIGKSDFLGYIRGRIEHYSLAARHLEFEVTESAYLENFTVANNFFQEIGNMGCGIALDDFGTGYSSLGYLTQLRLNTLKIDKSFVDGLGLSSRSTLITKTIIDMARHLNLAVCAEGVETESQARALFGFGCDYLQGYLFSRPVPLPQLALELERLQAVTAWSSTLPGEV